MDDINESDCCGNGCSNCVLNIKTPKSLKADKCGKQNILSKYTKFVLISKTLHLPQVRTVWELHFKSTLCGNDDYILDINVGYHVMMRKILTTVIKDGKCGDDVELERKYLLRPYSPYWWDDIKMEFKILVHLIPEGIMSEFIDNLKINDEVEFRGPIGTFEHQTDSTGDKCLLLISQGVATAPMIAVIEEILNNENDMTRIIHIACYQDLKHIYFRDNLYNFTKYWNYKNYIFLSRQVCDVCVGQCLETCPNFKTKLKYKENIKLARLTSTELLNIVIQLNCKKDNIYVAIAGTAKFQMDFKELLQTESYDISEDNIFLL